MQLVCAWAPVSWYLWYLLLHIHLWVNMKLDLPITSWLVCFADTWPFYSCLYIIIGVYPLTVILIWYTCCRSLRNQSASQSPSPSHQVSSGNRDQAIYSSVPEETCRKNREFLASLDFMQVCTCIHVHCLSESTWTIYLYQQSISSAKLICVTVATLDLIRKTRIEYLKSWHLSAHLM